MSPPQCASVSSLPTELVEEYLVFLGPSELREMEGVSRRLQSIIHHRKLWRNLFEHQCRTSRWSLPHSEPASWKHSFHQYVKEQKVFKTTSRTDLSGSFVWRTLSIWDHLPDPYDTATSEPFELGTAQGAPVRWTLLVQHVVRDNCKHLGVFLQQEQANIWAVFRMSVLDRAGKAVSSHTAYQTFEGGQDIATNTRGWLFPVQAISEALQNNELVVEVELTMFPNELPALESVYSLIQDGGVCEDTRVALISVFGDFVSSKPYAVKRYLQEFNGGPLALVNLLEDTRSSLRLQQAAAGALWNILDSSKIYLEENVLRRMINAACLGLHSIFCDERHQLRQAKTSGHEGVLPLAGQRKCACCYHTDARYDDPTLEPESEFRGHLVNTLTGLLWNIPITAQYRSLLAANRSFFPSLVAILGDSSVSRTHFSGLHLLSTMHKYNHLPAELVPVFRLHLQEKMSTGEATDVGVLLSLRDVADFFVPLLLSPKLECVAFGAWCLGLFYYEGAPVTA